jgi:LmbE family N-acetylglucosaminyl deacetylase
MSKGKYNLVCVAHPDDETIFFGGTILQGAKAKGAAPWRVVCFTDGNADNDGARRKKQFEAACKMLGVKHLDWAGLPDRYEQRLDTNSMEAYLRRLPPPSAIYTHGVLGEYGHPHHQDVSVAVHRAFAGHKNIFSVAYNSFPEKVITLKESDFKKKAKILTDVYGSETSRFLNLLPVTFTEGYQRLSLSEVELLYDYFTGNSVLTPKALKRYPWLKEFLETNRDRARPF